MTGAPLNAQPLLVPGTVAIIAPPSFGNATLPGELPPLPLLSSIARPLLGILARPVPSVYTQPSNMLQIAVAKSRGMILPAFKTPRCIRLLCSYSSAVLGLTLADPRP